MSDELKVSTPEEYMRLTTRKLRTKSGAVFQVRAMGAQATVYLLGIMPEDGFENQAALLEFCEEHLVGLVKHVIEPSIVAPKVEDIAFLDVVDLLLTVMEVSGFAEGDDESFRDAEGSVNA